MSKAFDSIKQGLDEALEFSKGKAIVHEFSPVDVKNIRAQVPLWPTRPHDFNLS